MNTPQTHSEIPSSTTTPLPSATTYPPRPGASGSFRMPPATTPANGPGIASPAAVPAISRGVASSNRVFKTIGAALIIVALFVSALLFSRRSPATQTVPARELVNRAEAASGTMAASTQRVSRPVGETADEDARLLEEILKP